MSGHGLRQCEIGRSYMYLRHSCDNVRGQNCTSVYTGRPVLQSASEIMYDPREEEELVILNDARMASTES